MILRWLRRWRESRLLRRQRIPERLWLSAAAPLPALQHLTHPQLHRLRELASLLLHDKTFTGAGGLTVTDTMRVQIAAQACLLVLELGLDYFDGWQEIIIYPDAFVVQRDQHDDNGLVHETHSTLGGEAWDRGPVILSWQDAQAGMQGHGANVILHEFAHKLDMLNGRANGMPPLHAEMSRQAWTAALSSAYHELQQQLAHQGHAAIDPYGAENPAEFFAVLSENFFMQPQHLRHVYPAVYSQLAQFYRQEPVQRLASEPHSVS